jgi:hypothetical protein
VGSAPGGLAQIVETAFDGTNAVGQTQVTAPASMESHILLDGTYSKVHVLKDIALVAVAQQPASITSFTQTFSQTPEPAGIALLASGALLALFGRRRFGPRMPLALAVGLGFMGFLLVPPTASAMNLQDLINAPGSPLVSGSLEFRNFGFEVVGSSGVSIADALSIDVEPISMGGEDGLQFAGLIAALSNIQSNSMVTVNLDYDVKTLNPARGIHDLSLSFNGAVTSSDGVTQLGESVLHGGSGVGQGFVTAAAIDDHQDLTDGPYTDTLHVHNRIVVQGGNSGQATISFINQTFSQGEVPEPAVILLLGLGAPAVMRRRRR